MSAKGWSDRGSETLSPSEVEQIDRICDRFEAAFLAVEGPEIERYVGEWNGAESARTFLFRSLLDLDLDLRREQGERPSAGEYAARFPGHAALIADAFADAPTQPRQTPPIGERASSTTETFAPEYEFLFSISDPEYQAALSSVRAVRETSGAHTSSATTGTWVGSGSGQTGSSRGRFRVLRFHRGGGLGDVYVAVDLELDREVALKEIKANYADEPSCQSRFVFEAKVTGGLEHPGIVPVYGLGHDENGRPFYAMRFIRGDTLRAAIDRFHRADSAEAGRNPTERALAFRELLGRFLDVCDAIAYAHHRGVLHRDLKPGNVLLGRYGETLVVDWGLAKLMNRPAESAEQAEAEPTLRPPSASHTGDTMPGRAIGTIGYMPPEQALGQLDQLVPASDVYSLGAMLYSLLTGKSPLKSSGDSTLDVENIVSGNIPLPRAVDPRVPPALEAVCMKAMAFEPAARYPSPDALADEIKHWLADEPVSAHREPWIERLARWSRRHRAWTRAAAVSLLVVTLVSTMAALAVSRAYRNERLARAAEQRAREESEDHFATARSVVNDALYKVARGEMAFLPGAEATRERLINQAVRFTEVLLERRPRDPSLRSDAATVYREAGNVRRLLGQFEPALECYQPAIALLKGLADEFPAKDEYRNQLALIEADLGGLYLKNGKPAAAIAPIREALECMGTLRAKAPDDSRHSRTQALALTTLASAQFDIGLYPEARQASEQALALWTHVAAEPKAQPNDPVYVIMARVQIGDSSREMGDSSRALEAYREALQAAEAHERDHPRSADAILVLADARNSLGELLNLRSSGVGHGEPDQAQVLFDQAVKAMTTLVRTRPLVPGYRRVLATAYRGRGDARLAAGKVGPAEADSKAARVELESLLEKSDLPHDRYRLGRTLASLARIARARNQNDQARDLFQQAVQQHKRTLELNPQSARDRKFLALCQGELETRKDDPVKGPENGGRKP